MTSATLLSRSGFVGWARVTIAALIAIAAYAGVNDRAYRVILAGRVRAVGFDQRCRCWRLDVDTPLGMVLTWSERTFEAAPGKALIAIGDVDPHEHPAVVNVEQLYLFELPSLTARSIAALPRRYPAEAMVMAFVLVVFGWPTIAMASRFATAAFTMLSAAFGVSALVSCGILAPPIAFWLLTLAAAACVGWKIATLAEVLLDGNVQSKTAACVIALVVGDMSGFVLGILGFVLPTISQTSVVAFVVAMCLAGAVGLPPCAERFVAAGTLVISCVNRYRFRPYFPIN